jgi:hypothetical protein
MQLSRIIGEAWIKPEERKLYLILIDSKKSYDSGESLWTAKKSYDGGEGDCRGYIILSLLEIT